jgi:hypothetical protein
MPCIEIAAKLVVSSPLGITNELRSQSVPGVRFVEVVCGLGHIPTVLINE